MCGRFTLTLSKKALDEFLKTRYDILSSQSFDIPQYNISPSNEVISILHDGTKHRVGQLKWGYRPTYSTQNKSFEIINAKSETLFDKSIFKESALKRRCVILADSFYEWHADKSIKNPYRFMTDQKVFPMAAIWQTVQTPRGEKIHTVAIITTDSNELMKDIHHRMPVILTKENENMWLDSKIRDEKVLKSLLKPYDATNMRYEQVSTRVNHTRNNDPSLIEKII